MKVITEIQKKMEILAEKTNLVFDGGDDDRLFVEEMDRFNIEAMGSDIYEEWEQNLNHSKVKGEGFTVYAWNDSGGYEYWMSEEKTNYMMVTVLIDDIDKALLNTDKIQDAIGEFYTLVAEYSSFNIEYAGYPETDS